MSQALAERVDQRVRHFECVQSGKQLIASEFRKLRLELREEGLALHHAQWVCRELLRHFELNRLSQSPEAGFAPAPCHYIMAVLRCECPVWNNLEMRISTSPFHGEAISRHCVHIHQRVKRGCEQGSLHTLSYSCTGSLDHRSKDTSICNVASEYICYREASLYSLPLGETSRVHYACESLHYRVERSLGGVLVLRPEP